MMGEGDDNFGDGTLTFDHPKIKATGPRGGQTGRFEMFVHFFSAML